MFYRVSIYHVSYFKILYHWLVKHVINRKDVKTVATLQKNQMSKSLLSLCSHDFPSEARVKGVMLRWWQPRHEGAGHDQWALDHVEVVL